MTILERKAVLLQLEGGGDPIYFSSANIEVREVDENTIEVTVSQTP